MLTSHPGRGWTSSPQDWPIGPPRLLARPQGHHHPGLVGPGGRGKHWAAPLRGPLTQCCQMVRKLIKYPTGGMAGHGRQTSCSSTYVSSITPQTNNHGHAHQQVQASVVTLPSVSTMGGGVSFGSDTTDKEWWNKGRLISSRCRSVGAGTSRHLSLTSSIDGMRRKEI